MFSKSTLGTSLLDLLFKLVKRDKDQLFQFEVDESEVKSQKILGGGLLSNNKKSNVF